MRLAHEHPSESLASGVALPVNPLEQNRIITTSGFGRTYVPNATILLFYRHFVDVWALNPAVRPPVWAAVLTG
jgi:hypothetical protein